MSRRSKTEAAWAAMQEAVPEAERHSLAEEEAQLQAAALDYAARGWPVHAHTSPKGPTLGAKARDGENWGSTTGRAIINGWRNFVDIGIPTGPRSGLLDIDVDDNARWAEVRGDNPEPTTRSFVSGDIDAAGLSRYHLLFEYPDDLVIGNRSPFGPGVDVRGDGGQFVAPPSLHKSTGRRYAWVDESILVAPLPGWLHDIFEADQRQTRPGGERREFDGETSNYAWAALDGELATVAEAAAVEEGLSWNTKINHAAWRFGQLAAGGQLDGPGALDLLREAAAPRTWVDESEMEATIQSGYSKGLLYPLLPDDGTGLAVADLVEARRFREAVNVLRWAGRPDSEIRELVASWL